jgi:alkanesulfonate monooxygenase SsuD/methylene tetrahydromethanopterin reductase-like flavin-dependent oxidoreductase (luciferase family)
MNDTAVQFGFCVPIFASPGPNLFRTPNFPTIDPPAAMELAKQADVLGYDSIWVADHLLLGKDDAILEGWTVLSAIAGATRRAKLGMIHQALLFRNPALAAKMAATLDQISGGRLIHFMDCGYLRREYVSYGMPWDDLDARVARLVEATELTLALWSAETRSPGTVRRTALTARSAGPVRCSGRILPSGSVRPRPACSTSARASDRDGTPRPSRCRSSGSASTPSMRPAGASVGHARSLS